MSTQYGFYIDSSRCTGCKTCELACKDFKNLSPEVNFRRIYEYAGGDWTEQDGVYTQNVFAYYLSISLYFFYIRHSAFINIFTPLSVALLNLNHKRIVQMLIFGAVALVIVLTAYLIYVLFHAEAF